MTQEEKDLLLRDICSRLPYGVKLQKTYDTSEPAELYSIDLEHNTVKFYKYKGEALTICDAGFIEKYEKLRFKPYLFPLSSMTEEQSMELFKLFVISSVDSIGANYIKINECTGITFFLDKGFNVETHLDKLIDWLNKNHFDYRGLIPIGLAIDATGLNIY